MAKWFGEIGFVESVETAPGVWKNEIVTRNYQGEMHRNNRRYQTTDQVNDDIVLNNELSIISDLYASDHAYMIRYAKVSGTKWRVTNVEIQYPRLILNLGGVYND